MVYNTENFPLYPEEINASPATVCVTGGTGFVAGAIIERLLRGGHTVHTTVRDPSNEKKLTQLKALPGAADRLKFFKGDCLKEGSFNEAMKGCKYVLHTASPFFNPEKQEDVKPKLLDPALNGTTFALEAVNATPSVERVVLTSSVAAIFASKPDGEALTEADWNTSASETESQYSYSKTIAERRAWEIADAQKRWKLVTVNPVFVVGPPVGDRADGTSVELVTQLFNGEMPSYKMGRYPLVDVRDVAAAHCLCMVHPKAEGRHIAFEGAYTLEEIGSWISEKYPSQSPVKGEAGQLGKISNAKLQREVGLQFHPAKQAIQDMCARLIEAGHISPKQEE